MAVEMLRWVWGKSDGVVYHCVMRSGLSDPRSTWKLAAAWAFLLFALNCFVAWPLIGAGFTTHTESVEGAYIALARYLPAHWNVVNGWWPLWYCGMPFQNVYQPLLHVASGLLVQQMQMNPASAYHTVIAVAYALGPSAFVLLALGITRGLGLAVAASLIYSLVSPSAILAPAIRQDLGGVWWPRRFQVIVNGYGDGPHVASLTLIPLALLAAYQFLHKPTLGNLCLTSIAIAMVVLTNIPGSMMLAFGLLALTFAYSDRSNALANVARIGIAGLFAYLLCSHFLSPSTARTVFQNVQMTKGPSVFGFSSLFNGLLLNFGMLGVGVLGRWFRWPAYVVFFACWSWPLGLLVLCNAWLHVELLPQPYRFHLAFEMAVIPLIISTLIPLWPKRRSAGIVALLVLGAITLIQTLRCRAYANHLVQPIDITQTSEYRMSQAFQKYAPGERVMAPGSVSFWLNAFADNPQVNGCCTQGNIAPGAPVAQFEFFTDALAGARAGEISELWLVSMGASAVGVSGPRSTEPYKAVQHPLKFRNRLPVLWQNNDDVIYRLPVRHPGIVHAVPEDSVVRRAPVNGIDVEPLRPFAAALRDEQAGVSKVSWTNYKALSFVSDLTAQDCISVQVPYHPGWRATADGGDIPIAKDALGFMILRPGTGRRHVSLLFDHWRELWFFDVLDFLAIATVLVVTVVPRLRIKAV